MGKSKILQIHSTSHYGGVLFSGLKVLRLEIEISTCILAVFLIPLFAMHHKIYEWTDYETEFILFDLVPHFVTNFSLLRSGFSKKIENYIRLNNYQLLSYINPFLFGSYFICSRLSLLDCPAMQNQYRVIEFRLPLALTFTIQMIKNGSDQWFGLFWVRFSIRKYNWIF